MSSVPKGRRKQHDFVATHNLIKLRKTITELAISDFGYDREKFEKKIEEFERWSGNTEAAERMRARNESYYTDFVEEETKVTRQILRETAAEYEMGNSIFPSGDTTMEEYKERRLHLNRAIGHLHMLIQEMQYIADILPSDKNRYERLVEEIRQEIRLIKGVRRAANKFIKKQP